MYLAHMVGEHASDRGISWVLFGVSVVLALAVTVIAYKRARKALAKEEVRKK